MKSYYTTLYVVLKTNHFCDLAVKTVAIPNTDDTVEMLLHDTPGKDVFKEFVQMHVRV